MIIRKGSMDFYRRIPHERSPLEVMREYAVQMPIALKSIIDATEELEKVYSSVFGVVNDYEADFANLFAHANSVQEKSEEATNVLPCRLLEMAQRMEDYIANHLKETNKKS